MRYSKFKSIALFEFERMISISRPVRDNAGRFVPANMILNHFRRKGLGVLEVTAGLEITCDCG